MQQPADRADHFPKIRKMVDIGSGADRKFAIPPRLFPLPDIQEKVASDWHDTEAVITMLPHPVEEFLLLGELVAERASVGLAGIKVVGAQPPYP